MERGCANGSVLRQGLKAECAPFDRTGSGVGLGAPAEEGSGRELAQFEVEVDGVVDPPPPSRTPLIRSLGGKVFDAEDETRVHPGVQTRGRGAVGEQRPTTDADCSRTRDPTLYAETVAHGADGRFITAAGSRITWSRPCESTLR